MTISRSNPLPDGGREPEGWTVKNRVTAHASDGAQLGMRSSVLVGSMTLPTPDSLRDVSRDELIVLVMQGGLKQCHTSAITELRQFAAGLQKD